ncbi:MAG TPA: PKD domain-containing protein, partial [Candidatus Bathyarchaeia archaeon]|nr:PKD domain-containing protein [Candidatus Bathyarchaeia archaeon]
SGPFYDDLIGGIPILPHHVWAAACNWPVGIAEPAVTTLQASQCANPLDDPMVPLTGQTTGRMVGSGAFECLGVAGTAAPGVPGGPCSQTANGAPGSSSNTLGGRLLLTAFKNYHRGGVADQGTKYQKFSWADKFGAGIVTIGDIADAALHNKHYDSYWASPLYSSSPATCSATGGPGTGTLQCVDIGDIGTIALYKGIGVSDPVPIGGTCSSTPPLPLTTFLCLDPHFNRFNSGTAAPAGSVFLGSTGVAPGSTSMTFSTFVGSGTTISTVTAVGTTGLTSTAAGTCTAGLSSPDGPGRTTYTCTFGTALAPDINGDTEVELALTFSNGASTSIEINTPSRSLIVGFTIKPVASDTTSTPAPGQTVSFTAGAVTGTSGYTPVAPLTYAWTFGDGAAGTNAQTQSHAYAAAGTDTATLIITDANGVTGTFSLAIQVKPFTVSFTSANAATPAHNVTFAASTTNGNSPFAFSWNFGDGTTGTGATTSHTYAAAGTFTVTLTVIDSYDGVTAGPSPPANTATITKTITVP